MSTEQRCPKCGGPMAQGFVADFDHGGSRHVASWVEGAPHKKFWVGTEIPAGKSIPIGTFRCEKCGFLESFARPEFAAS